MGRAVALYRQGDAGEAVRDIQERLAALGFSCLPDPAGSFGPGTTAAVEQFQASRPSRRRRHHHFGHLEKSGRCRLPPGRPLALLPAAHAPRRRCGRSAARPQRPRLRPRPGRRHLRGGRPPRRPGLPAEPPPPRGRHRGPAVPRRALPDGAGHPARRGATPCGSGCGSALCPPPSPGSGCSWMPSCRDDHEAAQAWEAGVGGRRTARGARGPGLPLPQRRHPAPREPAGPPGQRTGRRPRAGLLPPGQRRPRGLLLRLRPQPQRGRRGSGRGGGTAARAVARRPGAARAAADPGPRHRGGRPRPWGHGSAAPSSGPSKPGCPRARGTRAAP